MGARLTTAVDHTTMGGMLRWHAVHRPADLALTCGAATRTWRQLDERVNKTANGLLARGVKSGDRLAIMLPNRIEFLELYLACAKLGVTATPVNYLLAAREIAHVLDDSRAVGVIHDAAKARVIADVLATPRAAIVPGASLVVGGSDKAAASYEDTVDTAASDEPPTRATGEEAFFLGYTSGTTGFPKGCLQLHRSFVNHYKLGARLYPHQPGEVMLIPGPLFHEAPTLFALAHLFAGGAVVVLPAFDGRDALDTIARERCTAIGFAVPTMLDRMAEAHSGQDLSSVRSIICAGAPLRPPTIERTLATFAHAELHEFYGATEIGLATNIRHRAEGRPGSCGKPFPGISVIVLDDAGNPVAPGATGTVYISPLLMEGYLNNEAGTQACIVKRGDVSWFTLGDMGYLDPEGYLHLVDRRTHMIISGGENVYPAEVELVLASHSAVTDVAVIGLPDDKWGEAVTAVVVTSRADLSLAELRDHCDGHIARYKMPKILRTVAELPRTPSGKVQKHVLRAQLLAAATKA